jgi:hypothetical protein
MLLMLMLLLLLLLMLLMLLLLPPDKQSGLKSRPNSLSSYARTFPGQCFGMAAQPC